MDYLITKLSIMVPIPPIKSGNSSMILQHHGDSMIDSQLFWGQLFIWIHIKVFLSKWECCHRHALNSVLHSKYYFTNQNIYLYDYLQLGNNKIRICKLISIQLYVGYLTFLAKLDAVHIFVRNFVQLDPCFQLKTNFNEINNNNKGYQIYLVLSYVRMF